MCSRFAVSKKRTLTKPYLMTDEKITFAIRFF